MFGELSLLPASLLEHSYGEGMLKTMFIVSLDGQSPSWISGSNASATEKVPCDDLR